MEELFVRARDGTELFVGHSGSGPPVVLCDGIGCNGFILRYLRPALERDHQVIHWHYRGHGQSRVPTDPHAIGIPELRDDLEQVLDALGLSQVVLLGYSMGVQLALDFALHRPDRVKALVPMCGSYGHLLDTFHDRSWLSRAFPLLRSAVARWPGVAQQIWTRAITSEPFYQVAVHLEVEGRLLKRADFSPYFEHLAHMDTAFFFRMLEEVRHHTVEPRLHEITAPTLVIAGERDTFTPVWLSQRMARHIPEAEILVVPFGTHTAPLEMPELVELRLRKFLEERVMPSSPELAPNQRRRARSPQPQAVAVES